MENLLLYKLQNGDFSDIEGTSISVKLPLTREFLNWNLEQLSINNIKSIKIDYIKENRMSAIAIKTKLLVRLNIFLEILEDMEGSDLRLRMRITDGLGRIGRSIVNNLLPHGMSITNGIININLQYFLFDNFEYKHLLDKITYAKFTGGEDKIFLELQLKF